METNLHLYTTGDPTCGYLRLPVFLDCASRPVSAGARPAEGSRYYYLCRSERASGKNLSERAPLASGHASRQWTKKIQQTADACAIWGRQRTPPGPQGATRGRAAPLSLSLPRTQSEV